MTKGSMTTINLVANTDLRTAEEFGKLVMREENGAIVRLKDIADVDLGAEDYDTDVRFSGQKATFIGVWALPTANSLDVIKAIRAEIPEIEKQLPAGMKVGIPYDATNYIQDALKEVIHTLVETLLIVVVVIFLFLGFAPGGDHPRGGDPDFADRRGVPDAGVWLHASTC